MLYIHVFVSYAFSNMHVCRLASKLHGNVHRLLENLVI